MSYAPNLDTAFSVFKFCSIAELNDYMNNESKLDEVIRDLPQASFSRVNRIYLARPQNPSPRFFKQMKGWQDEKAMLLATNKSLAEKNCKHEPRLNELKKELEIKSISAQAMLIELSEKQFVIERAGGVKSPDAILDLLQSEYSSLEESSEDLAQRFLSSDYTPEAFLDEYLKLRRQVHSKRVKVDKLKELMRNRRVSTGSLSSLNPLPVRAAPPPPQPGYPPYPLPSYRP
ncbi:unnamed protein product [Notodromas monacha]|uniref:VPS37 C-terminal domain-containing protein n=1 Tax=Notodromas monacha TaxID=399045 RepID=A0A7R9BC84_9CRUS|nr:unnamed protein product [Notodromas monacha]CAG0912627.1 unnamed protein product [Notodromas monacha]